MGRPRQHGGGAVILFSMGLPGSFSRWCDAVLVQLAGLNGEPVAKTTWPPLNEMLAFGGVSSTLDGVARALIGSDAQHVVLGARLPDERLRAALTSRDVPFLIGLDDPRNAVADILAENAVAPPLVTRAVANSCPLVLRYTELPGALTVNAERAALDPAATVAAIAAHFGIAAAPDAVAGIVDSLAAQEPWATTGAARDWASRVPADYRNTIDGALFGYGECFVGRPLDQLIWTRDLFYLADPALSSLAVPLDAAGGNRIVTYGPYIQLPAGSWAVRVLLGFSAEAAGYSFMVDAFNGTLLASTTFQPHHAGAYAADLNFSIADPGGLGLEVRIFVGSDDARGQLAFGQVVLKSISSRHDGTAAVAGSDFTSVLGI
jgi:hypothetical protein